MSLLKFTATTTPTPLNSTCTLLQGDAAGYAILATCTGAPSSQTTADIFQHGCLMNRTDSGTGTNALYQNTGSTAVPSWTLLDTGVEQDATVLVDSNGVISLSIGTTASAVNGLIVTNSATGAVGANAVVIAPGAPSGSDAAISLSITPKGVTGITTIGLATGTGTITVGSSSGAQTVAIGNGAGVSTVNIAHNGATGNVVNIADGAFASTVTIGNTTGATAVAIKAGSGGIAITGVLSATSAVLTTPAIGAATGTSLSLTGAATLKNATAVPATAGAVAAGAPIISNTNGMTIEWTTDAPTHTRPKGSVCININGSSSSTRMYINTDGAGTWTSVTTAA